MRTMDRPQLMEIPLKDALCLKPATITITIDEGAWDYLIKSVYENGGTLIEIRDEMPIRAFRNTPPVVLKVHSMAVGGTTKIKQEKDHGLVDK
jgi:hypothetical protein